MNVGLSVAHCEEDGGVEYDGYTEWMISSVVTELVAEKLGLPSYSAREASSYKKEKTNWINSNWFDWALEIHMNSIGANGSATIHSPYGNVSLKRKMAQRGFTELLRLGLNKHYEGVFEVPGSYSQRRNFFLSWTDCPAFIVELGSIKQVVQLLERKEDGYEFIAACVSRMIEEMENEFS